MSWRSVLATLGGIVLAAAAVLWLVERQISSAWFRVGLQPEVVAALERSLDDRKALARLDPAREAEYRRRFEADQAVLNRLRILEHNRAEIVRRYELLLLGAVGTVLLAAGGAHLLRQRVRERRIERLRDALVELSAGRDDVVLGDRRRDTLGRIAAMVEETSRVMTRDRRRLAYLRNLSGWQEAARRHAHEMRTPLAAARLELDRLRDALGGDEVARPAEARQAAESLREELDRLGRFTRQFTTFGRLPRPRLEVCDLAPLVGEFAATFSRAWPNLELVLDPPEGGPPGRFLAAADRDMLRQVLVNLCDNSAQALGERRGAVVLRLGGTAASAHLELRDDGPGIAPEVRDRLFEPYVTTRREGEGMGLGLAISKKVLLDHGGDLELVDTSAAGTKFRLTLPAAAGGEAP